jgi:hypothetical protein
VTGLASATVRGGAASLQVPACRDVAISSFYTPLLRCAVDTVPMHVQHSHLGMRLLLVLQHPSQKNPKKSFAPQRFQAKNEARSLKNRSFYA